MYNKLINNFMVKPVLRTVTVEQVEQTLIQDIFQSWAMRQTKFSNETEKDNLVFRLRLLANLNDNDVDVFFQKFQVLQSSTFFKFFTFVTIYPRKCLPISSFSNMHNILLSWNLILI